MLNIVNQYQVRPDHASAVGNPYNPPNRRGVQAFDIYLLGGQTLTIMAADGTVLQQARDEVIRAVDNLP